MIHNKHLQESLKKTLATRLQYRKTDHWTFCQSHKGKKNNILLHLPQICCVNSEVFYDVQKYGIQKKAPFLTQHQIISGI